MLVGVSCVVMTGTSDNNSYYQDCPSLLPVQLGGHQLNEGRKKNCHSPLGRDYHQPHTLKNLLLLDSKYLHLHQLSDIIKLYIDNLLECIYIITSNTLQL